MSDTRDQILALAMQRMQQKGFRGFSFRDLAGEIGIKSAAIHYHFPKKSDLGEALARKYFDDDVAYLNQVDDQAPTHRLDHFQRLFEQTLEQGIFCLFASAASDRGEVPEAMNAYAQRFFEYASSWVERAIRDAGGPGKTARPLASEFVALVYGAFLIAHNNRDLPGFRSVIRNYRKTRLGI